MCHRPPPPVRSEVNKTKKITTELFDALLRHPHEGVINVVASVVASVVAVFVVIGNINGGYDDEDDDDDYEDVDSAAQKAGVLTVAVGQRCLCTPRRLITKCSSLD
jgi:hypothetical protein